MYAWQCARVPPWSAVSNCTRPCVGPPLQSFLIYQLHHFSLTTPLDSWCHRGSIRVYLMGSLGSNRPWTRFRLERCDCLCRSTKLLLWFLRGQSMPPTRSHQRTADAATALTTVKELSRVVRVVRSFGEADGGRRTVADHGMYYWMCSTEFSEIFGQPPFSAF